MILEQYAPVLNANFQVSVNAELCRRSLYDFAVGAWPVLEPANDFIDNWHIKAICDHLQAVTEGKIRFLIINIPPRFMKSLLVSVLWPAWEWTMKPSKRWLTASYGQNLSERDAVKCRNLINSSWYQTRFGKSFRLSGDQNAKRRYENDATGFRVATSPDGLGTGEGGDHLVVDDPHNVKQVESDTTRQSTLQWWDETMSSRYNDPKTGSAVIVMQRIHEADLTGHLLRQGGWEHLCIPMEYDGIARETCLGPYDPRTTEGELLWEARFDRESVDRLKASLGSYGTACQLQQIPSPRGGGIFKRKDFQYYSILPELEEVVLSVDCTFKDAKTSDNVALQAWGIKGPNKYLLRRLAQKMGYGATVQAIKNFIALYPNYVAILIEDKANGSAVIETLSQGFSGVLAIEPHGGKVARAYAMQGEHEAGNIFLPSPTLDPTIEDFIQECTSFPNAVHDDEVDGMTQFVNWYRIRGRTSGLIDYYAKKVAEKNAAKKAA